MFIYCLFDKPSNHKETENFNTNMKHSKLSVAVYVACSIFYSKYNGLLFQNEMTSQTYI